MTATRHGLGRLVAAAVVATVLVIASAAGLMIYAGLSINQLTAERETALMTNAAQQAQTRLFEDVTSSTVWTEAYTSTTLAYDPAWAHTNYGLYYHQYMHHDSTVALTPDDKLVYASDAGEVAKLEQGLPLAAAARGLIERARADESRKLAADPAAKAFKRLGAAGGVIKVGPDWYMAVAATVVPEDPYKGRLAPHGAMVISARKLNAAYLGELEKSYNIGGARLTATPADGSAIPLRDAKGQTAVWLSWTPHRPAMSVFERASPALISGGLALMAALAMLFLHIRVLGRRLIQAKEAAVAADEAKSAFLANMSHEIRTPLNGVLGMTQVMQADELSPTQRQRLGVISEAGRALLGILNDVLDLSKAEAGMLELEVSQFSVEDLARTVCSTFEPSASARDIGLSFTLSPEASGWWRGDALRLRQVLSNLVSNAIKFTHDGSVSLEISARGGELVFEVQDTGIGLGPDQIPSLFQKFSQADVSTTRRYGGTGLGLSICQELAALMGGRLAVTSVKGEGSRFRFVVPLDRAEAPPERTMVPAEHAANASLRILAAEDNPTNQLVLRSLLAPLEADLVMAANGAEAVAAWKAGAFDVILMDIQMPEMNGIEATRAIRALEAGGADRIPILALSANVMAHQIEDYMAAGMDGWVAKPIELEKLYAALETALDRQANMDAVAA